MRPDLEVVQALQRPGELAQWPDVGIPMNAALYAGAAGARSPFRDVTVGGNGYAGVDGYDAAPGWDPVTGLGSADVGQLIRALA